jgi:hypothetical protein
MFQVAMRMNFDCRYLTEISGWRVAGTRIFVPTGVYRILPQRVQFLHGYGTKVWITDNSPGQQRRRDHRRDARR